MTIDLNKKSDQEILRIATPIMDNLMQGGTERNWEKHTQHFTEEAKADLTEDELQRQCEAYQSSHGHFKHREFIGITRHPEYVNIFWKQKMTKSSGEYLAGLTLVHKGKEYLVKRCWVDLYELER